MSLSGTFSTMPFSDLLQWLGDSGRSGLLVASLEFEERMLRFAGGRIVALGSDDPRARDLLPVVLARGLVDEKAVRRILAEREHSARPLYRILVEDGYLPGDKLAEVVRARVRDAMLQLFLWHDGRFRFTDELSSSPLDDVFLGTEEIPIEPPLVAREVLVDGMRRMDEWRRAAQLFPSDYCVVNALGRAADLPALEALADSGKPLALGDLCLRLPRARLEIVNELFEAHRRGLLAVDEGPRPGDRDASPLDTLVNTARTLIEEQQFDEAASLLRSAGELDPFHEEARSLLKTARREQMATLYQELPPVSVPMPTYQPERLATLPPRDRFLVSRVDGRWDVASLVMMSPLAEIDTLRSLKRLIHMGLVRLR